MSEKAPLTTSSIRKDMRSTPKYPDRKPPTSPEEWSQRLNNIYVEDRMNGMYWVDETNADLTVEERNHYVKQRQSDYLRQHIPARIQELGYEIDHEYEYVDGKGRRRKASLEIQNPNSRIGDLIFTRVEAPVKDILKKSLAKYKAGDAQAIRLFKSESEMAYRSLLKNDMVGNNFKEIKEYLELASLDDKNFILNQFTGAVERAYREDEALNRRVNMGSIARTAEGIKTGIESRKESKKHVVHRAVGATAWVRSNASEIKETTGQKIADRKSKKVQVKKIRQDVRSDMKTKKKEKRERARESRKEILKDVDYALDRGYDKIHGSGSRLLGRIAARIQKNPKKPDSAIEELEDSEIR